MSRRAPYRRLTAGLVGSVLLHAGAVLIAVWSFSEPTETPEEDFVPIELAPAPEVPLPPVVPDDLPTSGAATGRVEIPKSFGPTPPPAPEPAPTSAPDLPNPRVTNDSDVVATRPPKPRKPKKAAASTPTDPAGEKRLPVAFAMAAAFNPVRPPDLEALAAAQANPPIDPALVDLRPFVPSDSKLILVLRLDRVRDTAWAKPISKILAPMPDYRTILAGTRLRLADTFDTLVIATPDPSEVAHTFLAAHSARDDESLRNSLAGRPAKPKPNAAVNGAVVPEKKPRVSWSTIGSTPLGVRNDDRVERNDDPRVYVMPRERWVLLTRPEQLPHLFPPKDGAADPPEWLDQVTRVEDQTGPDGGPILVLSASEFEDARFELPGMPPIPAPERLTLTVTLHPEGMIFAGAATFPDETRAQEFLDAVTEAQARALDSLAAKFFLNSFHLTGAVKRLEVSRTGAFVTYSTSLSTPEAQALARNVAEWSRAWFASAHTRKPSTK